MDKNSLMDEDFWRPIDKEILKNRRLVAVKMYHDSDKSTGFWKHSRDVVYARQKLLLDRGLLAFNRTDKIGVARFKLTLSGLAFLDETETLSDLTVPVEKNELWEDYV